MFSKCNHFLRDPDKNLLPSLLVSPDLLLNSSRISSSFNSQAPIECAELDFRLGRL